VEKPVAKYKVAVTIPGVNSVLYGQQNEAFLKKFNKAWGFQDGACNEYVNGKLVGKDAHKSFEDAHWKIQKSSEVIIEVSVYKDGSKSYTII
jgi:hypothetical protein